MKKINLEPYTVTNRYLNKETGRAEPVEEPFMVKDSLLSLLMDRPDLKRNAIKLLELQKIALKIMDSDDYVLLEEAEYKEIKQAIETFQGYQGNHVEFIKRVLEAEDAQVQEVEQPPEPVKPVEEESA